VPQPEWQPLSPAQTSAPGRLKYLTSGGVLYLPAEEPGRAAAVFSRFRQSENVYATTAHHRVTPNGYSGFAPPSWIQLSKEMRFLPVPAALDRLRKLGVRFVVVRDWARGGAWDHLRNAFRAYPLEFVGRYGNDLLYRLPGRQPELTAST
jgi:hypothetical protein